MKQAFFVLVAVALAANPALAKPKEKTYPASCDQVWAAVKTATEPPHYNFAQLDDAQKKGTISTGNTMSGKRYLDITLSGAGSTCTVAIGGNFSGLAHNDKGDLFKRIEQALAETPSESAAKSNESVSIDVTKESQARSEQQVKGKAEIQKSADEVGAIVINSVPDGADVYVDGGFVGDASTTLKLAPGKHAIRVAFKGYKDWNRELSVLPSSDVKLTARLDKQD
jgi:hypothetical protein